MRYVTDKGKGLLLGMMMLALAGGVALAQTAQPDPSAVAGASPPVAAAPAPVSAPPSDGVFKANTTKPGLIDPDSMPSLFFSSWTHALIKEARLSFLTRPPTQGELNSTEDLSENKDPGVRELALGGIVYVQARDWTIWLNGQRITPQALPSEILDLNVERHYIELKWFDRYTNQVYPIRLRPHQRFNLDTRIFLPG